MATKARPKRLKAEDHSDYLNRVYKVVSLQKNIDCAEIFERKSGKLK